jgi:hypothetical protein
MAQDIGLLLRGLGAAVSNQVPQFRQQMMADQENQMRQQEFQAQQQQRMRQDEMQNFERMRTLQAAGYQDALALTELLKPESLNVEGALGLLEDRMALMDRMDMKIPNDPTRMIYDNLRRYAGSGDPAAFSTARNTAGALVVQGVARGDIKLPEAAAPKALSEANIIQTADGPIAVLQQSDGTFRRVPLDYTPAPKTEGSVREREARIQEYINLGMSRPQAIERLDAQYMTDPVTGNLIAINRATGQATIPEVRTAAPPARIPAPPSVTEEQLAFDPGKGTGLAASFLGLWNSTVGQAPFAPTFMGAETAAQQLTFLGRDAIKSMATSDRPPVIEQERILQALPQAMDWAENPATARSKLMSFIDLMTTQYVDDLRYSQNQRMPKDVRESSAERARAVEALIGRVLTPEAGKAMFDSLRSVEQSTQSIQLATPEQLQAIDPSTLDDAALDAYIERLKRG